MSKFSNILPASRIAEQMDRLEEQRETLRNSRRKFLAGIGTAGAAAGTLAFTGGLAGCSDGGQAPITPPPGGGGGGGSTPSAVLDVLNFALNLEYLEASFYSYVATGSGLPATDMGTAPGPVSGGAQVTFDDDFLQGVATQLATDEREHVEFLRSTITSLGGTPVDMPELNLAANGAVTTRNTFLLAARQLEDVGQSAYIGGAASLVSSANVLLAAAQILDTEAQHSGLIRELCIASGIDASKTAVDLIDLPPSQSQVFFTSSTTGLTPVRSTSQVLNVVYAANGAAGVSSGGFFPKGLNGNIKTTSAS